MYLRKIDEWQTLLDRNLQQKSCHSLQEDATTNKVVKLSQQNIKPIDNYRGIVQGGFLLFRPNNVEKFPVKCGAKRIDPSRDLYIDYYNTFHQAALHLEALHCISLNFFVH